MTLLSEANKHLPEDGGSFVWRIRLRPSEPSKEASGFRPLAFTMLSMRVRRHFPQPLGGNGIWISSFGLLCRAWGNLGAVLSGRHAPHGSKKLKLNLVLLRGTSVGNPLCFWEEREVSVFTHVRVKEHSSLFIL